MSTKPSRPASTASSHASSGSSAKLRRFAHEAGLPLRGPNQMASQGWNVETLEPRLLLSADILPGVQDSQDAMGPPSPPERYELVLQRRSLADAQVVAINGGASPDPGNATPGQPGTLDPAQPVAALNLAVRDVSVAAAVPGGAIASGGLLRVAWNTLNHGDSATVGDFADRVTLRRADTGDIVAQATVVYVASEAGNGPLLASQSVARQVDIRLPAGPVGAGDLTVTVETAAGDGQPGTGGENGSSASANFTSQAAPYASLEAADLSIGPAGAWTAGQTVTASWSTRNTGTLAATGNWTEHLELLNLTTGAVVADLTQSFMDQRIEAGGAASRSAALTWPGDPDALGMFRLRVRIDASAEQPEPAMDAPSETSPSIQFAPSVAPVLAFRNLRLLQAAPQAGDTVTLTWEDVNMGPVPTPTAYQDRAVIRQRNADGTPGAVIADSTVAFAGTAALPLAPGEARARSFTFALPAGAAGAGAFDISLGVDGDSVGTGLLFETNPASGADNRVANTSKSLAALDQLSSPLDAAKADTLVQTQAQAQALTIQPTITWVGNADGFWDDVNNWQDAATGTHRLPGASDDVLIDLAAANPKVTIRSGTQTVRSLVSAEALTISGGSLILNGNSEISGDLALSNGMLGGTGAVTVAGAFTVGGNNAILSGAGTFTTLGASTVSMGAASGYLGVGGGKAWTNQGTLTVGGAASILFGVGGGGANSLTNTGTAVLNLASSNAHPLGYNSGTATVTNQGTVNLAAAGTHAVSTAFVNAGAVNVSAGTLALSGNGGAAPDSGPYRVAAGAGLSFAGGTRALGAGSSVTGGGTLMVSGGTDLLPKIASIAANGSLALRNGRNVARSGTLSNAAAWTWAVTPTPSAATPRPPPAPSTWTSTATPPPACTATWSAPARSPWRAPSTPMPPRACCRRATATTWSATRPEPVPSTASPAWRVPATTSSPRNIRART